MSDEYEALADERPTCSSLKQVLRSGIFWKLYVMIVLSSFYGSYMYSVAKPYGLAKNGDDSFNTLALTIAGLVGGSLRFLWTWAIDHIGFMKVNAVLLAFIICVSCTLPSIASIKALYFIWIVFSVACDAAVLAVFSTASTLAFGIQVGATAMALLFSGIAIVLVGGSLGTTYAVDQIGYEYFFYGSGIATGIALLLHLFVKTSNPNPRNEH